MSAIVYAITAGMEQSEWLRARKNGIGGSEAAVIAGLSKYKSPMDLWLEKTGQVKDTEAGEAAYWGTMLESIVAEEFTRRTGIKVRRRNAILQHAEHKFMLANVDRLIVGQNAGLEVKTANEYLKSEWEDDKIPDAYYLQCQHYMAVTGYQSWYIAVLIGGNKFTYKHFQRNDELITKLVDLESEFWQHVINGTMPSVDGSDACAEALLKMYPASNGEEIVLPDTADILIREYEQAKQDLDDAERRKKKAQNDLEKMLGINERGRVGDRLVTWKTIKGRETFEKEKFKEDYPHLVDKYFTVGEPTRRFGLK